MKLLRVLLLLSLVLTGCTAPEPPVETVAAVTAMVQDTLTPTPTVTNTSVPPTITPTFPVVPRATFTPMPTPTEMPRISTFLPTLYPTSQALTRTLELTATRPAPVHAFVPETGETGLSVKGRGLKDVDIKKWPGPALFWLRHTGVTPYKVSTFAENGQALGDLFSGNGRYQGTRPLDFSGTQTGRLLFETLSGWEVRIAPLEQAHPLPVPGETGGIGDDVLAVADLQGRLPKATLEVDGRRTEGWLRITAYTGSADALARGAPLSAVGTLVDESAPYRGSVALPSTTLVLVVQAIGTWRIEVTTP